MKIQTIIKIVKSDNIIKIKKLRSEIKKSNDKNLKSAFNKLLIQHYDSGYKNLLFSGVTSGFYFQVLDRLKYYLIGYFKYSTKILPQNSTTHESLTDLLYLIKSYEFQKGKQNVYLRTLFNKIGLIDVPKYLNKVSIKTDEDGIYINDQRVNISKLLKIIPEFEIDKLKRGNVISGI